jgi:hypothetical protein
LRVSSNRAAWNLRQGGLDTTCGGRAGALFFGLVPHALAAQPLPYQWRPWENARDFFSVNKAAIG